MSERAKMPDSGDWKPPLRARIRLALAVLRGRQWWADGYPTPWAYERVCLTLRRTRGEA